MWISLKVTLGSWRRRHYYYYSFRIVLTAIYKGSHIQHRGPLQEENSHPQQVYPCPTPQCRPHSVLPPACQQRPCQEVLSFESPIPSLVHALSSAPLPKAVKTAQLFTIWEASSGNQFFTIKMCQSPTFPALPTPSSSSKKPASSVWEARSGTLPLLH